MKVLKVQRTRKNRRSVFWHVNIVQTENNEILLSSETYATKWNAYRAAVKASKDLKIKIVDDQKDQADKLKKWLQD